MKSLSEMGSREEILCKNVNMVKIGLFYVKLRENGRREARQRDCWLLGVAEGGTSWRRGDRALLVR
jgi:hypothetical protein